MNSFYARNLQAAEQSLHQPSAQGNAERKDSADSSAHKGRWYAESQEAHRVGADITRLALCYAVSNERDFATACAKRLAEAAMRQTAWDSPMQDLVISALARSICVAYDLIHDSGALEIQSESEGTAALVDKRLHEMGDWLEYYLVKGGNGLRRNHDVIAACTLGLVALTLRSDQSSEEWMRLAVSQLDQLFYADERYLGEDGDWYEGSFRYQLYILQWFHLFADACRNLGVVDYYARPKTEQFFRALSHFITPDGHNLGFNDTSHDEVIMLGLLPLLKGAIEYQDEKLFWCLQNIVAKLPEVPLIPPESFLALTHGQPPRQYSATDRATRMHFRRTGIIIARSEWSETASLFALECGPYASHNHLSKGTFEYYFAGQPILIDTGCGHYLDRARWIVPEMHNVVVVDGGYKPRYEHPLYGDTAFDFSPAFHGSILDIKSNRALCFVQADYSAFARTSAAIRNYWFVSPGYLFIEDRIEAQDSQISEYSAFYHAHGQVRQGAAPGHVIITTPTATRIAMQVHEPRDAEISIGQHPFANETIATVMSGGELSFPSRHLSTLDYLQVRTHGQEAWFLVAIIPERDTGIEQHSDRIESGHILRVKVSEVAEDIWVFRNVGNLLTHDAIRTDARVAFIRLVDQKPSVWFVLDGQQLSFEETILVASPIPTTFLSRLTS